MLEKQENIGSSFDDFLREYGLFEEVSAAAMTRALERQIERDSSGLQPSPRLPTQT